MNRYAQALSKAGMSPEAAESKASSFDELHRVAKDLGFRDPTHAFYVPGRIEVLGKHTDYCGGRSLICCVERGFCVVASSRDDRTVRFVDLASRSTAAWQFTPASSGLPVHWAIYPETVTRRVARNFPTVEHGVDVVFSSDLPRAAGMSSSSALIIASFFAIAAANELQKTEEFQRNLPTHEALATYLASVENGSSFGDLSGDTGVGTFGGSEDHTAILCCEAANISQFSFCPLRFERSIRIPDDLTFVIATSGVPSDKTGDAQEKYNRLSLTAKSVLEIWNRATGRSDSSLGSAVASSVTAADQIRELLRDGQISDPSSGDLSARFEQFFKENYMIVDRAGDALAHCDWTAFGELVDLSQNYAETLLANQVPETSFLARSARELGAIAASAFGAGFGGSVWALVPKTNTRQFIEDWPSRFRERFPHRPSATCFASNIGPAAQGI